MKIPKPVRHKIKEAESKSRKSLASVKHKMTEPEHKYHKKQIRKDAKDFYKARVKAGLKD